MSKCKTVTLRKRKIKNGTQYSLCLDYYPGYRDNTTMKVITREALGIYIFAKPANQQERDFNARMMKKAEILRNRRYEAIFNEITSPSDSRYDYRRRKPAVDGMVPAVRIQRGILHAF